MRRRRGEDCTILGDYVPAAELAYNQALVACRPEAHTLIAATENLLPKIIWRALSNRARRSERNGQARFAETTWERNDDRPSTSY